MRKMSTTPTREEVNNSEIKKRSEEELLEEETKNQQTIDIFIESDKNWCWSKNYFKGAINELKNLTILNSK